ncbi:MAG: SDR family NAD(P)-dependent oxidoreductase [Pseudomonadota bacterium]
MNVSKQKTAVISGGAGGLGLAMAEQLSDDGWQICIIDLPGKRMEDARARFSGKPFLFCECDLTIEEDVIKVSQSITKDCASIDLVIYNAGITQIGELTADPTDAHKRVFDVNYFGSLYLLRQMIEPVRKSEGMHLAVSSVAGFSPLFHRTAYSASKHALEGLFKSLRAEEQHHGVAVSIAAPSFVATNIGNPEHEAGGIARPGSATDGVDYMEPQEAAEVIIKGISQKRAYIPVGRIASLAWRINRFFPELYYRLMMRRMSKSKES